MSGCLPNLYRASSRNTALSRKLYVAPSSVPATKGFVKEVVTYMVMDDLVVKPMSAIYSIALLDKFNVKDFSVVQEKVVSFGMGEALRLVKASLESKTVLTDIFMSCREIVIRQNSGIGRRFIPS